VWPGAVPTNHNFSNLKHIVYVQYVQKFLQVCERWIVPNFYVYFACLFYKYSLKIGSKWLKKTCPTKTKL
jgi:hypothetical protein